MNRLFSFTKDFSFEVIRCESTPKRKFLNERDFLELTQMLVFA